MDDLYDNLENYNDVNIVDELKSENKDLKLKLGELSSAMGQLQKDFDKLNSEYKKLEINYSSLLKTARAEIQRKTEMINTLNAEKDKIILSTMQKSGKKVFNNKNHLYSKGQYKNNQQNTNVALDKEKQNRVEPVEYNNQVDNRVELPTCYTPSLDSLSSINTQNKPTCNEERAPKGDTNKLNNCDKYKNKENSSKTHPKDLSLKDDISSRRKSILVNSLHEAKFSSDEDVEPKNTDNTRTSHTRNELKDYEWQDTRDYRTEPYEYYEFSKEPSRSRTSRYSNFEYKNVEEYEPSTRNRRNYSPEINQQRYTNEYNEYYSSRGDYGKHRTHRSPPSDKYNRSKSRDRRFNYDRENYRDYDKHSSRYYEHSTGKHKIRNELDEPSCKRQKTESYGKYPAETNSYINERDREFAERTNILHPQEYNQTSSCQSPDHVNVDSNFPQHFVKEIMNTAATNLEDPRISSKKYILNICNNSPVLTTVVGRNIELKFVDKAAWGLENCGVPAALTKPIIEQGSDNLLKDIYMDIENQGLHDSLESGEIQNFDDDLATLYSRDVEPDHDNKNNDKNKSNESNTLCVNDDKKKGCDRKASEKPLSTKFKIPKVKKPDKTGNEKVTDSQDVCNISQKNLTELKNVNVESHKHIENNNDPTSEKLKINKHKNDNNMTDNSDSVKNVIDKRTQDIMRTIEGDLELSDEASDIVEYHENSINKLGTHETNLVLDVDKESTNSPSAKQNNSDLTALKSEKTSTKKSHTNKSSIKKDSTKASTKDSNKKRKSKRKTSEQKEADSSSKEQNGLSHDLKKMKEKEYKENVSKQTLNKFSDLFGDSSSLITPDDLGINNIPLQSAEKYASIFDNTQDAVDLSVEDIAKTLSNTKKDNAIDTVLDKIPDKKTVDTNTNHFSVNVTVVDDNGENITESKNVPSSNVYENTTSETLTNESSVVKTVIISSGVQTRHSTASDNSSSDAPTVTAITDDAILKKCPLNSIKALATSTPQKYAEQDVSDGLKDVTCSNTIVPTEETNVLSNMNNSSNVNNSVEAENEADIPDVRIFVRRRRKIVKKPT